MSEAKKTGRRGRNACLWAAVATLLVGVVLQFGPWPTAWTGTLYLTLVYPVRSALTSRLVDSTPLSVSAGVALVVLLVPLLQLVLLGRRRWRVAATTLGLTLAGLALLFPLTFGLAYRLEPLEQRLGLTEPLNISQRRAVENWVLAQLQDAAAPPTTDQRWLVEAGTAAAASNCVARTAASLGRALPHLPRRLKYLPAGSMLSFGFAGVVSPWLLEPHVDAGLTPSSALAVALHEFAHSAGFAPEAEAEAVGLVAGLECDDVEVRYAALLRVAGDLAAAMPSQAAREYTGLWPRRALNDARAAAAAAAGFRSARLAEAAGSAYSLYLQGQGGSEGLGEYRRGTELALRYLARQLGS